MNTADVTIVVTPRERFSMAERSLESIYDQTDYPFKLIYVDGGSPRSVKRSLEEQSRRRGFKLIRADHFLSPNQARNISIPLVETKYVVFVDNDVVVGPGWLRALHRCAEDTGAWLVGPLYCVGPIEDEMIHMAGGEARIVEDDGRRRFREAHLHCGRHLPDVRDRLKRTSCELLEFHCMLARREVFDRIGLLDEGLLSDREHIDLCLEVRKAGGLVIFEPAAVISYLPATSFAWSDLPFYLLRWSDVWNRASLQYFNQKWALPDDPRDIHYAWLSDHRRLAFKWLKDPLLRLVGWRVSTWIEQRLEGLATAILVARNDRQVSAWKNQPVISAARF